MKARERITTSKERTESGVRLVEDRESFGPARSQAPQHPGAHLGLAAVPAHGDDRSALGVIELPIRGEGHGERALDARVERVPRLFHTIGRTAEFRAMPPMLRWYHE